MYNLYGLTEEEISIVEGRPSAEDSLKQLARDETARLEQEFQEYGQRHLRD